MTISNSEIKNRINENSDCAPEKAEVWKEDSFINAKYIGTDHSYKHTIVWPNAIGFLILHLLAAWGLLITITGGIKLKTFLWTYCVTIISGLAVTIGAHRYYTHRCFKATPLLRAYLLLTQAIAGQNSMFIWCRDHRLHHRYSDTDGDPHNAKRGFFFSHIGWLMYKKHPLVIKLGRRIDMSDLEADWMVMFQKKYYYYLYALMAIFIPVWVPVHYFGEPLLNSFLVCYIFRYVFQLNATWLVNSAAHLYGTRPYDKNNQPVESWFVSFFGLGEGWHNYHHTFPWDYKAAELPDFFNLSARVIHLFAWLGLAYDLKSADKEMVKNRIIRSGDGTHYKLGTEEGKKAVTALIGPVHPMNPTYKTTYPDPAAVLKPSGLPLFHENDIFVDQTNVSLEKRVYASG